MATITSVGSGLWSAPGTWDAGVPVDGDDVVIASGHVVVFDVNQSAFTVGVKITITGTLNHAVTGGPYTMFIKTEASVVGAGTWNIGTSVAPIPFAVKHTITGASGWYVDGNAGLTLTVFGAEPSIKTVLLSGDEAIGQTELSVDTDVTGDIWADGDIIRIDDINKDDESEERVIAGGGIASGTITITSGLTAAKSTGAVVSLITRNIRIICAGTTNRTFTSFNSSGTLGADKLVVGGGMWYGIVGKTIVYSAFGLKVSGGTFSNATNAFDNIYDGVISGGVFTGNVVALSYTRNCLISGGSFSGNSTAVINVGRGISISGGIFKGNNNVIYDSANIDITAGTFSGNNYVMSLVHGIRVANIVFSGNTYTLGRVSDACLHKTTFSDGIEHGSYTHISAPSYTNTQSIDHDNNDGALKAWSCGGIVTSQTSIKPDGYEQAYLSDLESGFRPCFWHKTLNVEAGATVTIEVQLRKDASMTYLPRVYLMNSIENPFVGATPVDTFTMTDSTDTWETDTFSITNSTDYDQDYMLWFVAQNATGNAYSAYKITTTSGNGISRSRLLGGV